MLVLSLLPLVLGGALLALLAPRGVGRRRVVFAPFPAAAEHDHGHGDEFAAGTLVGLSSGRRFSSSVWWWDATVLLVVAALVGDAAALGFLDPTLSRHLQSLLGLGVRQMGAWAWGFENWVLGGFGFMGTRRVCGMSSADRLHLRIQPHARAIHPGLVFALTPFIYSTTALLVQPLSDRWGHKHIIAGGLLCVGLAFLGLGPVPLPLAAVPSAGPLGDEQQQGAWVCEVWGVGCGWGVGANVVGGKGRAWPPTPASARFSPGTVYAFHQNQTSASGLGVGAGAGLPGVHRARQRVRHCARLPLAS